MTFFFQTNTIRVIFKKNIMNLPSFIMAVNCRFCFEVHDKRASVHDKSSTQRRGLIKAF